MVQPGDSFQQYEVGPLVIRPRSTRNILIDNVAQLSSEIRKTRARGLILMNDALGDIILPQDREKCGYNYWRGGGGIRYLASRFDPEFYSQYPELRDIYERIGGFFANMIFFADAVLDEQKPSASFVDNFLNGCAAYVKNPRELQDYTFPNDPRFLKVKAAMICAHEVGKALNDLEAWAKHHDRIQEFKRCRNSFLSAAESLKDAEIESFNCQQNPYLTVDEYDQVTNGKSVHIFYAGVAIIIPLSQEAIARKENLLSVSKLTTTYIHVQMCDDIEDLKKDIPDWFSISSYLSNLEGYDELKDEFFAFVEASRILTFLEIKSDDTENTINQMKKRMVSILWKTGLIPEILQTIGRPRYYKPFREEAVKILSGEEFCTKFRMELKFILLGLSGIQILFANALLLKRRLKLR